MADIGFSGDVCSGAYLIWRLFYCHLSPRRRSPPLFLIPLAILSCSCPTFCHLVLNTNRFHRRSISVFRAPAKKIQKPRMTHHSSPWIRRCRLMSRFVGRKTDIGYDGTTFKKCFIHTSKMHTSVKTNLMLQCTFELLPLNVQLFADMVTCQCWTSMNEASITCMHGRAIQC